MALNANVRECGFVYKVSIFKMRLNLKIDYIWNNCLDCMLSFIISIVERLSQQRWRLTVCHNFHDINASLNAIITRQSLQWLTLRALQASQALQTLQALQALKVLNNDQRTHEKQNNFANLIKKIVSICLDYYICVNSDRNNFNINWPIHNASPYLSEIHKGGSVKTPPLSSKILKNPSPCRLSR